MSGVLGWLAAAGVPVECWERITPHVQTAAVEAHTEQVHSVAETDPMTSLLSGSGLGSTEPAWLRVLRERVERAEFERDIALGEYLLGQARFASMQPVWQVEA